VCGHENGFSLPGGLELVPDCELIEMLVIEKANELRINFVSCRVVGMAIMNFRGVATHCRRFFERSGMKESKIICYFWARADTCQWIVRTNKREMILSGLS
jgi:hypothetical protein